MAFIASRKNKSEPLLSAGLVSTVRSLFFFSSYHARFYVPQWPEQYLPCHMMVLQGDVCSSYPEVASKFPPIGSGQTSDHNLSFLDFVADSIQWPQPLTLLAPSALDKIVNQN